MIISVPWLVMSFVIPRIQFTFVPPAAHWSLVFSSLSLKSFSARLLTSHIDPVLYWSLSLFQPKDRILHLVKLRTALGRQSSSLSHYVCKMVLPSDLFLHLPTQFGVIIRILLSFLRSGEINYSRIKEINCLKFENYLFWYYFKIVIFQRANTWVKIWL